MLKRSKRRKTISSSPKISRDPQRSVPMAIDIPPSSLPPQTTPFQPRSSEPFPPYQGTFPSQDYPEHGTNSTVNPMPQHYPHLPYPHSTDGHVWRGNEQTSSDQLPVWMTDHSLGGTDFSQHGMDAFIMPTEYVPAAPQIW
jgi:hypothetical protein